MVVNSWSIIVISLNRIVDLLIFNLTIAMIPQPNGYRGVSTLLRYDKAETAYALRYVCYTLTLTLALPGFTVIANVAG